MISNPSGNSRSTSLCIAFISAVAFLTVKELCAQTSQPTLKLKSVPEMLTRSEESAKASGFGGTLLSQLLRNANKYPRSTLDSVATGLEAIALKSRNEKARAWAAGELARGGTSDQPQPGLLDRTLRVYRGSGDGLVRHTIVAYMANQHERAKAIAFLKSVASESPRQQDFIQASLSAVSALGNMGSEGRAALIELRDVGALRDPSALGFVNWYFRQEQRM